MSKNSKEIRPSAGGFFPELTMRIKLIVRLISDSRVSMFLKIIPIGSVVYWLMPDLLPGPIDDAALMFVGGYLFVELCPPKVVEEHLKALTGNKTEAMPEDVVDADFREI
jgi:hypothetical protein